MVFNKLSAWSWIFFDQYELLKCRWVCLEMSWRALRVWNIADRLLVYHIFTLLYSFVFFQISVASLWKYFTMNLSFLRQKWLFNRFLNSYINILSDQQIRPFFLSRTMLCCVVLLTSCVHIFNLIIIWNCTHVL